MKYSILIVLLTVALVGCNSAKKAQRKTARTHTVERQTVNTETKQTGVTVTKSKTVTTESIDTMVKGDTKKIDTRPTVLKPGKNDIPDTDISIYDSLGNILTDARRALTDLSVYLDTAAGTIRISGTIQEQDKTVKQNKTTTRDEEKKEDKTTIAQYEAIRQHENTTTVKEKDKEVERGPNFKVLLIIIAAIVAIGAAVWAYIKRATFLRWFKK